MSYPLLDHAVDEFLTVAGAEDYSSRVLSTIAYRRDLESEISLLTHQTLGVNIRVDLQSKKRVAALAYNGATHNLVNEGFGANQLIILLAQIVASPEHSTVAVEEPEIHLHPSAQVKLADVFIQLVNSTKKQLIITTHSEHVLVGLLTAVASGKLDADDLAIYHMKKGIDGPVEAERLRVDRRGRIKGGLRGFIDTSLEELENYLGAVSKR